MLAHSFKALARRKRSTVHGCPWAVCSRCGLVALKNVASVAAAKRECPGSHKLEGVHVYRALNLKTP